jgi:uncharacterized protein YndB with AHSA1/START domain
MSTTPKSRTFETELRIQSTPEAVWEALTTPEGVTSWFAPEARVNPGDGGSIWISWGPGMEGESRIAAWDPARRFSYAQDRPDREPVVVEFLIEGQGGSTVLRLVQSGFGTEARFDDEVESTSRAWMLFLFLLKHGLEHPHSVARNVMILRFIDRPRQELWEALGAIPQEGRITFDDGVGCRSIEYPDLNHAITGIFCEKCGGQTVVTIMSILYDPAPGVEDRLRTEWTAVVDSLAVSSQDRVVHADQSQDEGSTSATNR